MAIESKNHHASDRVEVRISQASRRDAQGPKAPQWESYRQEYDALVLQKKEIESVLSLDFSKGAYSGAQAKLRREYSTNKSFTEWLKLRGEMDRRRGELVGRKNEIEQRLSIIKPKLYLEKQEIHVASEQSINSERTQAIKEIAINLEEVKDLLLRLVTKLGA